MKANRFAAGAAMTHPWDEFSKSLAEESLPRRESLRRLGVLIAGAVLSPLAIGAARGGGPDPCKAFCKCRNKTQQSDCLAACHACNGNTSRLCGSCGSYACTDFANDVANCGACFNNCWYGARANEETACIDGECVYACVVGAVSCNGTCTFLDRDAANCGACGNVCPASAPICVGGACVARTCLPNCSDGWCGGDGCGGECGCPNGWICDSTGDYGRLNYCVLVDPCTPDNPYYPNC